MTVLKLIKKLQAMPPDSKVMIWDDEYGESEIKTCETGEQYWGTYPGMTEEIKAQCIKEYPNTVWL